MIEELKTMNKIKNKNIDYMITGVITGIIGLGLQNINPFEPADITHFNSILLGLCILIIYFVVYKRLICFLIKKYKKRGNE